MTKSNSRRSFITKSLLAGTGLSFISSYGKGFETAVNKTPKLSAPSDLKITDIKCAYIRNGSGLFVKVHTNQGIWGCGEGVDAVPGTYHLVKSFARRIKGQNPF